MNILITGGAGFIGSNLALKLISKNHKVRVLDNLSPQIHGLDPLKTSPLYRSIINKVDFLNGTVTSLEDWKIALKDQDVVVHLAAETGTGQSMYEIYKYTNVNINGTSVFLDYITNNPTTIKKVVIASSRAIYGEGKYNCKAHGVVYPNTRLDKDMLNGDFNCKCPICSNNLELLPTSEDSIIHPTSVYGISKQVQEQLVMTVCNSINIDAVAFRYQNVYGPGQSLTNPYTGILSIFSTQIKNGNNINIFEDGKESRDFVYIDDVVNATILGIENENANHKIFNVGSSKPIDVLTVANTLKLKYNSQIEINITGNYRLGDIRHNFADMTKIFKILQFKPSIDFDLGIQHFVDWVNLQNNHIDKYQDSIEEMKKKGLFK